MVPLVRMEIPIVPMGPFRHATARSAQNAVSRAIGSASRCPRESFSHYRYTLKKALKRGLFLMVPLVRIGLTTPPLPRECSTTEP